MPPSAADRMASFDIADGAPFSALDTKKMVDKGLGLQLKYFREVTAPVDLRSDEVRIKSGAFLDIIRERYLMWLGDLPAKWVSTGDQTGRIMADGDVVFDNFKLTEASDKGLDDLTLDLYIDLYEEYQLTAVGNEHGVFAFATRQTMSDHARSRLMGVTLDRRGIAKLTNSIHRVISAFVEETNYYELLNKLWNSGARELLDQSYLVYAFGGNGDARAVVEQRGLGGVLQNDADLVRNVAAISLAASAEMTPEGLVSRCHDLPMNPSETIRRVKDLWRHEDLPLACIGDDGFFRSAF